MTDLDDIGDSASIPLHLVGPDGTIAYANQAQLDLLGYPPDEYIGRRIGEFHADADVGADILRRLAAGEKIREYPARLRARDGSIRHVLIDAGGPVETAGIVHTRCFTRAVPAEMIARPMADHGLDRFALLADAGALLAGSLDYGETLERIAGFLVPRVADLAAVHVITERQTLELVALAHTRPEMGPPARRWLGRDPLSLAAPHGLPRVIRTGQPRLWPRVSARILRRIARDPEALEEVLALGMTSAIAVPLIARGRTFGSVVVMTAESGREYGEVDVVVMREIGRRAALAADNARLYQRTESARADAEAAAESLGRLAAIVRDSSDAIISKTLDGTITSWNRAAEAMYGYAADEVIGKPIAIIVPPELHDDEMKILSRLRSGEHIEHYETVRVRKDGSRFDVSLAVSPIRNARGDIVAASKVARDITARTQLELERRGLLEREQRARAAAEAARRSAEFLADAAALLSSSLDYQTTLTRVTHAMVPELADLAAIDMRADDGSIQRLATAHVEPGQEERVRDNRNRHGYSPDGPIATAMRTGVSQLMPDVADAHLVKMANDPEQLEVFRALGIVSGLFVPLRVRGQVLGVMTLIATTRSGRHYAREDQARVEDLAQRAAVAIDNAQLYRAAEQARAAAESANRTKDQFLATVSHELRTPLNSILGWARMIENGDLDPDGVARAARTIVRSASSQAQLIDDLLDLSRVAAGRMRLEVAPCRLGAIVEQAVEVVRPSAEAKRIALSTAPDPGAGAVLGDPERLKQVVLNLLVNAIKFTPRGGRVAIGVRETSRDAELTVADNGEGIAPAVLPHVFEQFRQEDASTTRAHGGLGLGLTLVKHLIELHGGRVDAQSPGKGQGSTFTVILPLATSPATAPPAAGTGGV
jgi:PAS domain S-box-containing protein